MQRRGCRSGKSTLPNMIRFHELVPDSNIARRHHILKVDPAMDRVGSGTDDNEIGLRQLRKRERSYKC